MKPSDWNQADYRYHVGKILRENGMDFKHPRSLSAQSAIFTRLGYPADTPLLLMPLEGWEAFAAIVEKFDYEQFLNRNKAA